MGVREWGMGVTGRFHLSWQVFYFKPEVHPPFSRDLVAEVECTISLQGKYNLPSLLNSPFLWLAMGYRGQNGREFKLK